MINHLRFMYQGTSASGKTKKWIVVNADGTALGWIEWKAEWRRYWFCPVNGTGFDGDCLGEIKDFLGEAMQERI